MNDSWPVAELDPVRRLRVIARTTPGALLGETVLDTPFDRVWEVASDLETSLPVLITDIRSFTITAQDGEQLEALARSPLGMRARFDIVIRPGWCLMQSRFLIGGLAAVPEGDSTRFAYLGGLRVPVVRHVERLLHPVFGPSSRRSLRRFTALLDG